MIHLNKNLIKTLMLLYREMDFYSYWHKLVPIQTKKINIHINNSVLFITPMYIMTIFTCYVLLLKCMVEQPKTMILYEYV